MVSSFSSFVSSSSVVRAWPGVCVLLAGARGCVCVCDSQSGMSKYHTVRIILAASVFALSAPRRHEQEKLTVAVLSFGGHCPLLA